MNSKKIIGEAGWFAPFVCLCLISTGLLRPRQHIRPVEHSRIVIDGAGDKVAIEEPFRGVVLTWGAWSIGGYLENTRAPQTVMNGGGASQREEFSKRLMSKIYPQVLSNDRYWDPVNGGWTQRAKSEIEGLLRYDAGAYLGNGGALGMLPELRRVGLPAFSLIKSFDSKQNWDEQCMITVRAENRLIGQPQTGEALIAHNQRRVAELARELQPETLTHRPRILVMGAATLHPTVTQPNIRRLYIKSPQNPYQLYILRAGATNASQGWIGEQPDAERILAMDPDYIFLMWYGEGPQEFMHDPRWKVLQAVRNKRVYRIPSNPGGGGLTGLIFQPISVRWMAEILHPDRLEPETRAMLRDTYLEEFGYRMSEEEIDKQLWVSENAGSAGAERFTREFVESRGSEGQTK